MKPENQQDQRPPGDLFRGYTRLTSGKIELFYSGGEIRHLRVGPVQVINAIYTAVRDRNWGTMGSDTESELVDQKKNGFEIKTILNFRDESELLKARITVRARKNHLTYTMEGIALTGFYRNRIGICILHPSGECRGKSLKVHHTDGSSTIGLFPDRVAPHQPFKNMACLQWYPSGSIRALLKLKGDIFEMEDQRNWTDASYKIYSTPLEEPFPVFIEKGTRLFQSLELEVDSTTDQPVPEKQPERGILRIDPRVTVPLPEIGISRNRGNQKLSQKEAQILKKIDFGHYRADLFLADASWHESFRSAVSEQQLLGWPLELALHFGQEPSAELDSFLAEYGSSPVPLRRLLLYDRDHLSGEEMLSTVVPRLREAFPGIPLGGGTDAYFAELNRNPPAKEWLDFVTFTLCPRVHASDTPSLVENIGAQEDVMNSAKDLLGMPVSVTAITLQQRFNAVAADRNGTGGGPPPSPPADTRQGTPFAAAWTLGSLKQLSLAGARSLTFFESAGPGGIIGQDAPGTAPSPEVQDMIRLYPLYHLFREILHHSPTLVIHTASSDPLLFEGLLLQGDQRNTLILANYTDVEQVIGIPGDEWKAAEVYELKESGWKKIPSSDADTDQITLKGNGICKLTLDR